MKATGPFGLFLAFCLIAASLPASGAGKGEPGPIHPAQVELGDRTADLQLLHDLAIDVDAVFRGYARIYATGEELDRLRELGFRLTVLEDDAPARAALARIHAGQSAESGIDGPPAQYHTYATLTSEMQQIAADHPDITRLISLGTSVQGRELWMMKVTRNPDLEEDEPEVEYIAAMHGDEVVGKEMCVNLLNLLTDQYGLDPRITDLVDNTEIWILPSMNPDGTELGRRYNADWVDLNRDFPDQFTDPVNDTAGRAPETAAVMNWRNTVAVALSANFHGGSLVANYPYDSNSTGSSIYSPTPDDTLFVSLSRTYADNNPSMAASNSSSSFNNGVTNGADWYAINGGMQDWNYVWYGNFNITLEVSNQKWPAASELSAFWDDNRESMLAYLEQSHDGVRGRVTDAATGVPLAATIRVAGSDRVTYTDPGLGDYHRNLLPGVYTLEYSATGYKTRVVHNVYATLAPAQRMDVALEPLAVDLQETAACADPDAACRDYLDPGETVPLRATLRNLGSPATGITARLVPTGWYAGVDRPEAAYPDLPAGASGDSASPYHGVVVESGVPLGHKLGFALEWSSAEGSGVSEPFYLPAGPATCTTVDATGLPLPINDRQTTGSSVVFGPDVETSEIQVTVDITHPYRGDLRVDLVSPGGARIALHDRSGGSGDDIVGTYGVDLAPFEPFSRLFQEATPGSWSLEVNDGVPGSTGMLNAWSLRLCGRDFEAQPPEMRIRDVSWSGSSTRLEWWPYTGMDSYKVYRTTDPSAAGSFTDVTGLDDDPADTVFLDDTADPILYWLVSGVGSNGEGPK